MTNEAGLEFAGVPLTKLKDIFVAVMGVTFALEVSGGLLGLFGPGLTGSIHLLETLVLTEVPLWFATVIFWGRGEAIWERNGPVIFRAMKTLDSIGFLFDYSEPAILALRAYRSKLTPEQYRTVQAAMYGGALAGLNRGLQQIATNDPALLAKWEEQWQRRESPAAPPD